jgi:hypothetical protein
MRERRKKRATKEAPQHKTTQQWSGRERDTSRARKLLASLYAVEGRLQERERNKGKEKKVWGILVGTLKFLCEIFSITPYLSLAVGHGLFHGFLLPACLVARPPCWPAAAARTTAALHTTPLTTFFCCFCSCRSCSCVKSYSKRSAEGSVIGSFSSQFLPKFYYAKRRFSSH